MASKGDKKERLLAAAKQLIHQKGYRNTSLSDIAGASNVPLGNVYYYFKTKDDIAAAVIAARAKEFQAWIAECEDDSDPKMRLLHYLDMPIANQASVTLHGCPLGSLAQELCKTDDALAGRAQHLFQAQVEWVAKQYELLGKEDPHGLALQFIATMQGISMLASTFNDPDIIMRQIDKLKAAVKAL